jgi:hypothetical protein
MIIRLLAGGTRLLLDGRRFIVNPFVKEFFGFRVSWCVLVDPAGLLLAERDVFLSCVVFKMTLAI